MRYVELPPSPRLASWVRCVWAFEAEEAGAAPDRIVPDGCCELVVHLGEPFMEVDARGRALTQPRIIFAGQVTRPLHLRSPANAHVLGVRFRSAGAQAFVGGSMRRATDRRLALDEIQPGLARGIVESLKAMGSVEARLDAVQALVLERIEQLGVHEDAAVSTCAGHIEESAGLVTVPELVEAAGLGRRQLERRFADAVGVSPALLATIYRFRSVFNLIEHDATRPWTDASIAAGYYDQSHFIRDFRRFVGCTPSEFHRTSRGLAAALV